MNCLQNNLSFVRSSYKIVQDNAKSVIVGFFIFVTIFKLN